MQKIGEAITKLESHVPEDIVAENYFSAPLRDYAKSIPDGDRISIANSPLLPIKSARTMLRGRRRPRSKIRWVPCDNAYSCTGLNLQQKQPRLEIEMGGIRLIALIGRLTPGQRSDLLNQIEQRMEKKQMPFFINLQVNIYYTDTGIKQATIVGVGQGRPDLDHHRPEDIPQNIRKFYDEFSTP